MYRRKDKQRNRFSRGYTWKKINGTRAEGASEEFMIV